MYSGDGALEANSSRASVAASSQKAGARPSLRPRVKPRGMTGSWDGSIELRSLIGCATNLASMPYSTVEARQGLLDTVATAIEQLGVALAALGEAYEQLDEQSAERLEEQLFRPVQIAYGRAQRTYAGFAERHELPSRAFPPAPMGAPSAGVRGSIDTANAAVAAADATLAELQDSMAPVEVGDGELRDGLREVRELLGQLSGRSREFVRTLGR
jgi:cob(I)alamin adenosyltransferase